MKRGELWWADLGPHRPQEQTGRRPVIVWQSDALTPGGFGTPSGRRRPCPGGFGTPSAPEAGWCARVRDRSGGHHLEEVSADRAGEPRQAPRIAALAEHDHSRADECRPRRGDPPHPRARRIGHRGTVPVIDAQRAAPDRRTTISTSAGWAARISRLRRRPRGPQRRPPPEAARPLRRRRCSPARGRA